MDTLDDTFEQDLRTMLRVHAEDVRPITAVDTTGVGSRHIAWGIAAPAVGVLVACIVVLLVILASPGSPSPSGSGVAKIGPESVEGLSAAEVADLLNLNGDHRPVVTGCNRGVGGDEVLYCLDDVPPMDDWTRAHIAAQLMGFVDNAAMHDYVDAVVERDRAKAEDATSAEVRRLDRAVLDRISALTEADTELP